MEEEIPIWIKSKYIQVIKSSRQKKSRIKEIVPAQEEKYEWGWVYGYIAKNLSEGSEISIVIEDEESQFDGYEFVCPNQKEAFQKEDIVMANIHVDEKDDEQDFLEQYPNDLTHLTHLHEPAILHCLRKRYEEDLIYTITGNILVACNPFKYLTDLYSRETMKYYHSLGLNQQQDTESTSPHVFSVADRAFRSMKEQFLEYQLSSNVKKASQQDQPINFNQSILVSGESGAGKTMSTKYIMKYLTTISKFNVDSRKSNQRENNIEQQILQSNPILESFGNARTIRNDNSSRFGKFIEIHFNAQQDILGGCIDTYLLEKVRLINQSHGERNFHVFYEILQGFTELERTTFFLHELEAPDFFLLCQSDTYERRDGVEDYDTYCELRQALQELHFSKEEIHDILTVTCLCLHLSNLEIREKANTTSAECEIDAQNEHLQPVLQLLGVTYQELNNAICFCTIQAGKKSLVRSMTLSQAQNALWGFIKASYGALFDFLVQRINSSFSVKQKEQRVSTNSTPTTNRRDAMKQKRAKNQSSSLQNQQAFIGILDIFGFESFETNSFEQLCINYCNETLQNQFNLFIFQNEQEDYKKEHISWKFIPFQSNQTTLDLFEHRRNGIFQILDDQCKAPGTTDKSFANELYRKCTDNQVFQATFVQKGSSYFAIHHYAGTVEYDTLGFIEKNKDQVPKEILNLLNSSTNSFFSQLAHILQENTSAAATAASPMSSRKLLHTSSKNVTQQRTVGYQFRHQLTLLMQKIRSTSPHYIRCIKPNDTLLPNDFHPKIVVEQLRCAGVVEAIRISRAGYPHRYTHANFLHSFQILGVRDLNLNSKKKPIIVLIEAIKRQIRQEVLYHVEDAQNANMDVEHWIQVGKTKIFCNMNAFEYLDRFRKRLLQTSAIQIQFFFRRFIRHKKIKSCVYIQTAWRKYYAQRIFRACLLISTWCQSRYKGNCARCCYKKMILELRTVALQSHLRMMKKYHEFQCQKRAATTIQCAYRRDCAIRTVIQLKIQAKNLECVVEERDALLDEKRDLKQELDMAKHLIETLQNQSNLCLEQHDEYVKASEFIDLQHDYQKKENDLKEQLELEAFSFDVISSKLYTILEEKNQYIDNPCCEEYEGECRMCLEKEKEVEELQNELECAKQNEAVLQEEIEDLREMMEEERRLLEKASSEQVLQSRVDPQEDLLSDLPQGICSSCLKRPCNRRLLNSDMELSVKTSSCTASIPTKSSRTSEHDLDHPLITVVNDSSKHSIFEKFNNETLSQYDDLSEVWDRQKHYDEMKSIGKSTLESECTRELRKALVNAQDEIEGLKLELAYHKAKHARDDGESQVSESSSIDLEPGVPRNIEVNSKDSKYNELERQVAKLERRVDDFSVSNSSRSEQLIHQLLQDNDYIKEQVKMQVEKLTEDALADRKTSFKVQSHVESYPEATCRMGRFMRYVIGSNRSSHPSSSTPMN